MLFLAFPSGVSLGLISDYTPGEFRGRMSAFYYFTQSVIGSILGPLIVALFTDYVFSDEMQLGQALAATAVITLPLAAIFAAGTLISFRQLMRNESKSFPGGETLSVHGSSRLT